MEQSYSNGLSYKSAEIVTSDAATARVGPWARSFKVNQVNVVITTVNNAAQTITVNREVIADDTTSDIDVGSFIIPDACVAGDVLRIDLRAVPNTDLAPGETLSFLSGAEGSAGAAYFIVVGNEYDEGPSPSASFSDVAKPRSGLGEIRYLAFTAA